MSKDFAKLGTTPSKLNVAEVHLEGRFTPIDEDKLDVICGPISMNPDRLEKYAFSYPIFLAGSSLAISSSTRVDREGSEAVIGVLENTTGISVLTERNAPILEKFQPALSEEIQKYLEQKKTEAELEFIKIYYSYEDAFIDLCSGQILYFVGDYDILEAYQEKFWTEKNCNVVVEGTTLSRETYAVLFSRKFLRTEEGLKFFLGFQKVLFESFQAGEIDAIFETNFVGKRMSPHLKNFFASYKRQLD